MALSLPQNRERFVAFLSSSSFVGLTFAGVQVAGMDWMKLGNENRISITPCMKV